MAALCETKSGNYNNIGILMLPGISIYRSQKTATSESEDELDSSYMTFEMCERKSTGNNNTGLILALRGASNYRSRMSAVSDKIILSRDYYASSSSGDDDANSSSATLSAEASKVQEQANNIGSLVLPGTSVFYALSQRTVSTIIFSSSDSDTTTSDSSFDHEISDQPNADRNQPTWKKGDLLGQGGFGCVYQGFNSETGQVCAIKQVPLDPDDDKSERRLQQLCQEKNILSQLSHPNVVKYYGSELGKKGFSIYMEYVSGGSIHDLLKKYGSFEERFIRHFTQQIVCGLAYLHDQNIVHRDIKGANILVNPNGEIKLADFGMARHVDSSSLMYSYKGTLRWMAPEVVNNKNGYTIAVDIWSLGCTILEMATGKPPWSQYNKEIAMKKIGNSEDLPAIPNHLSDEAKSFIKSCLQRDPMGRPAIHQLLDHPFVRDDISYYFHKL